MSEQDKKSIIPHIGIAVILIAILLLVFFWPSEKPMPTPEPQVVDLPALQVPEPEEPVIEEPAPEPIVQPEPITLPEPEPLDISDGTVKTKIIQASEVQALAHMVVDDALLQRFVISVTSMSDQELATNHRVLQPPEEPFKSFKQADKDWIDPASFKRYNPYVEALESVKIEAIMGLYQEYQPAIEQIFSEISEPGERFQIRIENAIELLLNTPEVPVPIEVYSDSVMYKFKDPKLEALSAPQKQLLRSGPENMRRIKAKLREIREALKQ